MSNLFYYIFIIAAMILAYFIVDKYLDIKSIKVKKIIRNATIAILILLIIFLIISLIYFFKSVTSIGPIWKNRSFILNKVYILV